MDNLEKDIALLRKIKKSESSPYLLSKIQSQIEQLDEKTIKGGKLIPFAVIFVLLIMVNIYALSFESKNSDSIITESHSFIYEPNQLYYD